MHVTFMGCGPSACSWPADDTRPSAPFRGGVGAWCGGAVAVERSRGGVGHGHVKWGQGRRRRPLSWCGSAATRGCLRRSARQSTGRVHRCGRGVRLDAWAGERAAGAPAPAREVLWTRAGAGGWRVGCPPCGRAADEANGRAARSSVGRAHDRAESAGRMTVSGREVDGRRWAIEGWTSSTTSAGTADDPSDPARLLATALEHRRVRVIRPGTVESGNLASAC